MMARILLLLFIVVPALELWVIFAIGRRIGGFEVFLLLLATAVLGFYLAKSEGRKILQFARNAASQGQPPGIPIIDGFCVFVGGMLLIVPGFITDIVGLLLVLPFTRPFFRTALLALLQRWMASGRFIYFRR